MKLNVIQQMMLDTGMLYIKPIPEYEGQYCISDCRREGCEHKEDFEEENGIKHVDVKSESVTTHYEVVLVEGKPMINVEGTILLK